MIGYNPPNAETLATRDTLTNLVDTSSSMLAELDKKRAQLGSALTCIQADITETTAGLSDWVGKVDGIVSSMALHHVKDTQALIH